MKKQLHPMTETPSLEARTTGKLAALVQTQDPSAAAARADEKAPAPAVGETDVLKADDEGGGVGRREDDGRSRVGGAD
jgi:hypothetical protein